jgi:tRNA1(Val) A37 N6-methylase TrmN6
VTPEGQAGLTRDAFLGGRLWIWQPATGYRAAMDPVLLAAAVPARPGDSALDLGCGVGTVALCLGARVPGMTLAGLEIQPAYAELARRNADDNALPLRVVDGDVAAMPSELRDRSFDHVLLNPPYFRTADGSPPPAPDRRAARHASLPLEPWFAAALRRTRSGGSVTAILPAARLAEGLAALDGQSGSIVVLPIVPRAGRDAGRVIVRARKGGRGAMRIAWPFVMHDGGRHLADGEDHSAAARAVLRDAKALEF